MSLVGIGAASGCAWLALQYGKSHEWPLWSCILVAFIGAIAGRVCLDVVLWLARP